MKLIFGVDAIFPPLTGIGRYAWELASRLAEHPELDEVRFFSMGRWVPDPAALLENPKSTIPTRRALAISARKWLSSRTWAVAAYARLSPLLYAYRLHALGDRIFHSPNYFLPPISGPGVATVHDLSTYKFPDTHPAARWRYFDREIKNTLRRADHLITDSEATRREVIEFFGWPAQKVTAIPLGVSPHFAPRSADELQMTLTRYGVESGRYALCVSTVEPRKRLDSLLRGYELLPDRVRARYPLVLAGGKGWLSDRLHELIDRGQRGGWVKYLGYVPEEDLPLLYAGARAFCFISIYEGFGLPVLEAMASGVPVLTSNRSSLPEVAGEAGMLVEPDDIDAVRTALERVLLDEPWRAHARRCGLERAAGMTWERCVERTVRLYSALY
ncbi:MAG TPA: glycosyltransferase family 1 protein [Candidatus Competibacteraceae bacterium]|nr:glycosyltransferase family 1 protein [Candidatus Competibacteraceae bacterium]